MSLPAGIKVEVGIGSAGAYVDVTADVVAESEISIRYGRGNQYDSPDAATMSLTLDNSSTCSTGEGSYTPGRQVLKDGTTAHPYYPNIKTRVNVRVSYTISAVTYYRFTGTVTAWQPSMGDDAMTPRVVITASDVLNRLGRITLRSVVDELVFDDPSYLWPLNDDAGSTSAVEAFGGPPMTPGVLPVFGSFGPGSSGVGIQVTPFDVLTATIAPPSGAFSISTYVYFTTLPSNFVEFFNSAAVSFGVDFAGGLSSVGGAAGVTVTTGVWHHVALTVAADFSSVLYYDGVAVGTYGAGSTGGPLASPATICDFQNFSTSAMVMNQGPVAIYPTQLSATRIAAQAAAGLSYYGDTTGARIARYLTLAGLTSAVWNLDTGAAVVGAYPQSGKTVLAACQDIAATEGGGAVFYATPDGKARFADRNYRNSTTLALTVDAGADLDGSQYQPSLDEATVITQATVTRASGDTTLSTQTYSDPATSPDQLTNTTLTSYATTDLDALMLAQSVVASSRTPGFRLPQLAVDLITATSAGLYASVAGVQIGSRLEVTSLDGAAAPRATMDFIAEGWTESIASDTYTIVYDTSPVDNPPRSKWGTARWQPNAGAVTLNATITRTATANALARTVGETAFTTTPGSYPLGIQIGEEIITEGSAPGGTTSPQSYTGATRGASGSLQAAQSAGAVVSLYPSSRWQL